MASGVKAKICGLRSYEAAREAVIGGADAIGFILAPSRRQVTIGDVSSIRTRLLQEFPSIPPIVGVTVNLPRAELDLLAETGVVDIVQLSGDEDPPLIDGFSLPVWKAIRVAPDETFERAIASVLAWLSAPTPAAAILLDAYHPEKFGGTGIVGDWEMSRRIAAQVPIWLAGGLTPENVTQAIASVRPFGVDVASGVETDGQKDPAKIRAFLSAVHG